MCQVDDYLRLDDQNKWDFFKHIIFTPLKSRLFFLSVLILPYTVNGQVLISLLFGDALNSEKVEFGLIGGLNRSYIYDIDESKGLNNFNLGFYFHINMKGNSFLSTGVLVKSNVGARGMETYSIGDPEFDDVYADGDLTKKIHYFYVPVMWHQRFNNRWYLEGGFQLGLRNKAYDYFKKDAYEGELSYKADVRDEYKHFDGGLVAGIGYKFRKETKSMSAGINYYYGLNNVSNREDLKIKNSAIYFYVKIPIGSSKEESKNKTTNQ